MRVSGIVNNPAWGQGPGGAERAGKDGQRKGHQHDPQGGSRKGGGDEVELQGKGGTVEQGTADGTVKKPGIKGGDAGRPPLDVSA